MLTSIGPFPTDCHLSSNQSLQQIKYSSRLDPINSDLLLLAHPTRFDSAQSLVMDLFNSALRNQIFLPTSLSPHGLITCSNSMAQPKELGKLKSANVTWQHRLSSVMDNIMWSTRLSPLESAPTDRPLRWTLSIGSFGSAFGPLVVALSLGSALSIRSSRHGPS